MATGARRKKVAKAERRPLFVIQHHKASHDIGHFEPEGDIDEGLEKGKLSFTLFGVRLTGDWTLVRMRPRAGESPAKPQWLLMRHHRKK